VRVLTILVRHGGDKYPDAEERLSLLFRNQLPRIHRDTVIVDTALPSGEHERRPGRVLIGGDNSSREFSGFQAGLSHVGTQIAEYDLVNLATSAFRQLYTAYLERFNDEVLDAICDRPVCLGHIDCYNEGIEVLGHASQHWVRTACLFLRPFHIKMLGSVVSTGNRIQWFSGNFREPFSAEAPLSTTYRRFIVDWLTGRDIGQGVKWHSPIDASPHAVEQFEGKAMAIINEHMLSIRLRAAGCRTIDVTWLSGLLAHRRPVDWDTRWWRQLAERDRHAVKVIASQSRPENV
jgi:hypothetical protein